MEFHLSTPKFVLGSWLLTRNVMLVGILAPWRPHLTVQQLGQTRLRLGFHCPTKKSGVLLLLSQGLFLNYTFTSSVNVAFRFCSFLLCIIVSHPGTLLFLFLRLL